MQILKKRVFVTGYGIVSAIGNNVEENLNSLRAGKTGIKKANHFQSKYVDEFSFGEVNLSNQELIDEIQFEDSSDLTRTDLFAIKAFQEALKYSGLELNEIANAETALLSASTVGGMCLTDQMYNDANLVIDRPSPYLAAYWNAAHTILLAKQYGIKGFTDTINTACSSSANTIMMGSRLIKAGRANRAIVGGTDSLAKFTVNGFNSLQILSSKACQPFDRDRSGITLGEGAAYLVLESEDVIGDRPLLAEVSGYGNSNDAFHPSSLSEDAIGVCAAMNKALQSAKISPDQIDYINAHGTATPNNDQVELTGIQKLFNRIPAYNSTKSYTGHTLAAAGSIEAIYSILSLKHQELYPSLQCKIPIEPFNQFPIKEFKKDQKLKYAMSNSFGFAGNCTSLILSKVS